MCKTLQCSVIFEENIQKLSPFKKKKKNAHLIKNAVVTTYVPSNSCPPPLENALSDILFNSEFA